MKTLNMTFEDKEFKALSKAKAKTMLTWEGFFLHLVKGGNDGKAKN